MSSRSVTFQSVVELTLVVLDSEASEGDIIPDTCNDDDDDAPFATPRDDVDSPDPFPPTRLFSADDGGTLSSESESEESPA